MTLLQLIKAYGDARARGELGRERAYVLNSQIERRLSDAQEWAEGDDDVLKDVLKILDGKL